MVRQNKNDLFLLFMFIAFAIIAMTSFSACTTSRKIVEKERYEKESKSDSTSVVTTASISEGAGASSSSATTTMTTDDVVEITRYEIAKDTLGMPIIGTDGKPVTYIIEVQSKSTKTEERTTAMSNECTTTKDSTYTTASSEVKTTDSSTYKAEKSVKEKSKPIYIKYILLAISAFLSLFMIAKLVKSNI